MTTGDVICPVCSAVNRSLNLEETDGWMECISCGAVVQVIHLEENYHSVYARRNNWLYLVYIVDISLNTFIFKNILQYLSFRVR